MGRTIIYVNRLLRHNQILIFISLLLLTSIFNTFSKSLEYKLPLNIEFILKSSKNTQQDYYIFGISIQVTIRTLLVIPSTPEFAVNLLWAARKKVAARWYFKDDMIRFKKCCRAYDLHLLKSLFCYISTTRYRTEQYIAFKLNVLILKYP